RDVERLVESGQVIRIPGGARLARSVAFEKTFAERHQKMGEAKNRIGRAAAALVKDGEALVLDSGTTTLCIARHLRSHRDLVVVTFSVAALQELGGCDSIRVELTGGVYRRSSHDLVGNAVDEALRRVHANKVFFGAASLSFAKGVMVYDPEEPRALIQSGAERILVLDSSKIGSEALYAFCDLKSCDLVITDNGIKSEHLARLRKRVPVLVAD
ncbi:MAG: DeoR/GlpR family DNA-binding transcription regulator, partial [Verrucomicrobia bacterium]|nr:DeoR/GlpR family DNA-binding transcription regulator [Verrucomicrobiota bacterium]